MGKKADWEQFLPWHAGLTVGQPVRLESGASSTRPAAQASPAHADAGETGRIARPAGGELSLEDKRRILTDFFAHTERRRLQQRYGYVDDTLLQDKIASNGVVLESRDAVKKLFDKLVRDGSIAIHGYRPPPVREASAGATQAQGKGKQKPVADRIRKK